MFKYPQESSDTRFYKLGRLNLPNGGNQATITINACNGYGTNSEGLKNSFRYYIPNYQMTTHIYSTTAFESISVSQGSFGSANDRYFDENYSLFYNGFVVVSSPSIRPLGFYLAPVPSDPLNQVDIWFHSLRWHGRPLVQVLQSEGSFTQSFENSPQMPLDGYLQLDMYANTFTELYKSPQ